MYQPQSLEEPKPSQPKCQNTCQPDKYLPWIEGFHLRFLRMLRLVPFTDGNSGRIMRGGISLLGLRPRQSQ
jgi:hypothetical protein